MAYGPSEDETRKKELREEAERETEKMMERERLQKKEREEHHQKKVKQDIALLESEKAKVELAIRAIQTEMLQLDATIRKGIQAPPQKIEREVRASEHSISSMQSELKEVERTEQETEREIREEEDTLRELQGTLRDTKQKENRLVAEIRESEHLLTSVRSQADEAGDIEERGRKAKTRKEAQTTQLRSLEKQRDAVHQKIEALRRTVTR